MGWQGRDSWQGTIETSLKGLGYELVDAERSAGGLLRVTIDQLPAAGVPRAGEDDRAITVDDCERATRQLQRVLEVEGVDYQRLEVSSPGLDRPLKRAADYARFAGRSIEQTLKAAFEGRKRWQGVLQANGEGWQLVLPGQDGSPEKALAFGLDEVREARLVPVVDFKGRGRTTKGEGKAVAPKAPKKEGAGRTGAPTDAAASPAPDGAGVHGGLDR